MHMSPSSVHPSSVPQSTNQLSDCIAHSNSTNLPVLTTFTLSVNNYYVKSYYYYAKVRFATLSVKAVTSVLVKVPFHMLGIFPLVQ